MPQKKLNSVAPHCLLRIQTELSSILYVLLCKLLDKIKFEKYLFREIDMFSIGTLLADKV